MQYKIVYKQGTNNRVADALSRRTHTCSSLFALSMSSPQWYHLVIDGYLLDDEAK